MRVHVMLIAVLGLAAVAWSYPTQNVDSNEEYGDYDDKPEVAAKGTTSASAPAARPTAARGRAPAVIAPRAPSKAPVRGAVPAAAAAPTTEKAKPVEEPEGDYEDGPADGAAEEGAVDASSTTEAPRKKVGGVVRPFRSNTDLIEALKRRRQQATQGGAPLIPLHSTSTTTPKPETTPGLKKASNGRALSVSNNNSKRKFGADSAPPATPVVSPRPPSPSRKFGPAPTGSVRPFKTGAASAPSAAPLTAAETSSSEVTADPSAPSRPRAFSRSRRL